MGWWKGGPIFDPKENQMMKVMAFLPCLYDGTSRHIGLIPMYLQGILVFGDREIGSCLGMYLKKSEMSFYWGFNAVKVFLGAVLKYARKLRVMALVYFAPGVICNPKRKMLFRGKNRSYFRFWKR